MLWSRGGIALPFLTSALDGGKWSPSHPGNFLPGERAPSTHWKRGWLCFKICLNIVKKRKISCPCWELNTNSLAIQLVAWSLYQLTLLSSFAEQVVVCRWRSLQNIGTSSKLHCVTSHKTIIFIVTSVRISNFFTYVYGMIFITSCLPQNLTI
jgi:hypothetical protein